MIKSILFSLLFVSGLNAFNIEIVNTTVQNGKTTLVEFEKEKNIAFIELSLDDKKYKIFNHPTNDKKMYALLPISYYAKPRDINVTLTYRENGTPAVKTLLFNIEDGNYEKETLKVDNAKVDLNAKDKKRAALETKETLKIYNTINKKSYIKSEFIFPMSSKITSAFGRARVYNETLKGYHSGTDFRAKVKTPIKASNDGVVVLAKDRFYSGGSIILDHGQGIYTCYFHMSQMNVKAGEKIKKSQIIGLSGKSGRVTGPHLHFSARVNGVQVDPMQLISLMNTKLLK